jgi:TatD DNase family protein
MFVDTHCHLNILSRKAVDAPLQEADFVIIDQAVKDAAVVGVTTIINVGTSIAESQNSIDIAARYESVYATIGVHPCDVTAAWSDEYTQLKQWAACKETLKIVGIGETGLDYYHKPFDAQLQQEVFKAHIELSIEYDLPLVVHVREAADDTLAILEQYKGRARGVIHCFQQSLEFARKVIELGYFVGIDAPITYTKNQPFRDIVAQIPLASIVLETDAPFLPPQELRGKPNHPAYIPLFVPTLANTHGVSVQEVAHQTSLNARILFGLK